MGRAADIQVPNVTPLTRNLVGEDSEIRSLRQKIAKLEQENTVLRAKSGGRFVDGEVRLNGQEDVEQALREDQERFRVFAEISSDWFWEMDADLRFTFVSKRYFELTGFSPEERLGRTRTSRINGEQIEKDREKWDEHLAVLAARKPFRDFEYSFKNKHGKEQHVRISGAPVFDDSGEFQGYRGTGTDITATVEAHEKSARAQTLFMHAVENMSEAFALFDKNDRLVFCNQMFRKLNPGLASILRPGLTFEEMLRDNIAHGRILEAHGREEAYIRERMEQHRFPGEAFVSERADGRWLMLREERAADGSTFLINTDLTEIKLREKALREAKERAERANQSKSEFLTMMSHELRTPLNAIIGFSDVLQQEMFGPLGSSHYQGYAKDILESGKHLLDLINDILDLSKIEAGKYALDLGSVDVADQVRRSGHLVRGQAREKGVKLTTVVAKGLPIIRADERAIRQILLNLLSNAVKFTPKGGSIRLRAVRGRDGGIRLTVFDTGIGIAAEDIQTIMLPFAQLADIAHTNFGGTGLGLPIVKSLVDMHGGRFSVKSKPGEWTRMTVELPESCVAE